MSKDDDFIVGQQLTQEQADAFSRARDKEAVAIKTRALRSRYEEATTIIGPYASGGGAACNSYNFHLFPTNERMFACLCVTVVAIVAIIYW
jgi:hypothetical protein